MAANVTLAPETEELVAFLEASAREMVSEAHRVPRVPENVGYFIELGKALAALDTLKAHARKTIIS